MKGARQRDTRLDLREPPAPPASGFTSPYRMTRAEFAARYRLSQRLTTHGVPTFAAQQAATGRSVMVHFLEGFAPAELGRIRGLMGALQTRERSAILETVEMDGTTVV